VIGPGGNTILGHLLPEDVGARLVQSILAPLTHRSSQTKLSVATWTAFRTPLFWKDGDKFIPERWIVGAAGYEEYHAYDRHDVFQAFGTGPRACIGKKYVTQILS
jgi:cytochrome P450